MDKEELKELLKENLSIYVSVENPCEDNAYTPKVTVSISFNGEEICSHEGYQE